MEANTLIRKVHMSCPLCGKTHELEERKRSVKKRMNRMIISFKE